MPTKSQFTSFQKVALQYLLGLAAEQIERLSEHLAAEDKVAALTAAERFRRAAEL